MSELNIGGSNVTVELRGDELYAKAKTGNKHWVAVITGTHPKYNYNREFVMYQKPRTSNRDSGAVPVENGAVIERVRYTHSGKNRSDAYYQLIDGEAYAIDEADITDALEGAVIPDVDAELDDSPSPRAFYADDLPSCVTRIHRCADCGETFERELKLRFHMTSSEECLSPRERHLAEQEDDAPEPREIRADLTPCVTERHVCEACDSTFTTAHGLATHEGMVHSDDTDSQAVTDGGQEVRPAREARHSDDLVREYSADGSLYAYREGDEHVVVSRGRDYGDKWTKRVPATREGVVTGEKLWTLPDNWEHTVTVAGEMINYAYYRIPESGVDVKVSVPKNDHIVDCWYGVKAIGTFEIGYADENDDAFDHDALTNIAEWEERYDSFPHKVSEEAQQLLERLADPDSAAMWRLKREYRASVNEFAPEHIREMWDDVRRPGVSDYVFDPWDVQWELPPVIVEAFDVSFEVAREVAGALGEYSAILSYPKVRIGITETTLGDGYYIRALIEAGCSPPQATDYLMCELEDETQSAWAEVRGKTQGTISGNITAAKRALDK